MSNMLFFREWLKTENILAWAKNQQNEFYKKGVSDAQDGQYRPPNVNSQMSAGNKFSYINGWRSMGKNIPAGRFGSHGLTDREWYQGQMRLHNYSNTTGRTTVDFKILDNPEFDDPDYDVTKG